MGENMKVEPYNEVDSLLHEVSIRKRNLEIKRQVQTSENNKELEILMLWESSLEHLKKEIASHEKQLL